ncbi:MAG: hypothetical protein WC307_06305 [Candidatus Nanoarchaeia archaeon]|jgi:hypothetical protein
MPKRCVGISDNHIMDLVRNGTSELRERVNTIEYLTNNSIDGLTHRLDRHVERSGHITVRWESLVIGLIFWMTMLICLFTTISLTPFIDGVLRCLGVVGGFMSGAIFISNAFERGRY